MDIYNILISEVDFYTNHLEGTLVYYINDANYPFVIFTTYHYDFHLTKIHCVIRYVVLNLVLIKN